MAFAAELRKLVDDALSETAALAVKCMKEECVKQAELGVFAASVRRKNRHGTAWCPENEKALADTLAGRIKSELEPDGLDGLEVSVTKDFIRFECNWYPYDDASGRPEFFARLARTARIARHQVLEKLSGKVVAMFMERCVNQAKDLVERARVRVRAQNLDAWDARADWFTLVQDGGAGGCYGLYLRCMLEEQISELAAGLQNVRIEIDSRGQLLYPGTADECYIVISYDATLSSAGAAAPAAAAATSAAAAPAAVSDDEVQITGERSREERDAEKRKLAIDVDEEPSLVSPHTAKKPKAEPKQVDLQ